MIHPSELLRLDRIARNAASAGGVVLRPPRIARLPCQTSRWTGERHLAAGAHQRYPVGALGEGVLPAALDQHALRGVRDRDYAKRRDDGDHVEAATGFVARITSPATGAPDSIRSSAGVIHGCSPAAVSTRST